MACLHPVTRALALHTLATACLLVLAPPLAAQTAAPPAAQPAADEENELPITFEARELRGRTGADLTAEGDAELVRGPTRISGDRLSFDQASRTARAAGNVRIERLGNVFTGPELELQLDRYEGYFLNPTYFFTQLDAGGRAERIDFLGREKVAATRANYSSCTPDDAGQYAWELTAQSVMLDTARNEGEARGAVLRFYGVPILGGPKLTFPLSDDRKSGWLPPTFNIDSKSGLDLAVPYYWNLAPNYDLTLTPNLMSKRGTALGTEFRYLRPRYQGEATLHLLPNDSITGTSRSLTRLNHRGDFGEDGRYRIELERASDDRYWRDFERNMRTQTRRLLPGSAQGEWWRDDWRFHARVQRWQVLQDPLSPIVSPYDREPQVGVSRNDEFGPGLRSSFTAELNRFVRSEPASPQLPYATRAHLLGNVSWSPVETPGWFLTSRLSVNAARYSLDRGTGFGDDSLARVIPTFSVENGWVFERESQWFGRNFLQTLEPRLMYVNTPYRDQSEVPSFDSAPRDFNFTSVFSPNPFSGIDRVADMHAVTAGAYTRFIDPATGAEALRLGLAQRYLLRDQRITPEGVPFTQPLSDVLLLGSTSMVPNWNFNGAVQYNPDLQRLIRSRVGASFSPGPFRTLSASYTLVRNASEQFVVGWQWPVYQGRNAGGSGDCNGSLYSVGRVNYSMREARITELLAGFEYDAGCWIGRAVMERRSLSTQDAVTRLLFQIEFVGLSRLGSNPLQLLKQNIPGYKLLREDNSPLAPNAP